MEAEERGERGGWPEVGLAEEGRSREEKAEEKPWMADLGGGGGIVFARREREREGLKRREGGG